MSTTSNEPNWVQGGTPGDRPASPPPPAPRATQPGPPTRRVPPPAVTRPGPATSHALRGKLRLADASAGLVREPLSLLLYGVEGVGKTSFGAAAPSALIIGAENGSAEIATARRISPATFEDVLGILEDLRAEQHDYRSAVLDSLDWLEPMVWRATCARGNEKGPKATIESFGYGKGFTEALHEWGMIIRALDAIRARGIHVILIAHSHVKPWKNPAGEDFDRYTLKLNDKASGLWKEWAKAVLFANFERTTVEVNDRTKGYDTGKRILYTRATAAYDAKNRLWLPAEIPLGWGPFARAVKAGEALRVRWYEALDKADEGAKAAAREAVEQSNYDPATIESVIAGLASAA